MFKIDFTRPHLYEDVVTLNQGNLSTNNTLRCTIVTGGNDDVTGASIACTFVVNGKQIFEAGKVVDGPRGTVDVVFPSEALVVGENTLEFLVNRVDGSVAQSPVVRYKVWQGLTTNEGVKADSNYPLLIELINQANSATVEANKALQGANNAINQCEDLKASVGDLKAECENTIIKANAAAEKAILAANNSDSKTAENIKNVNAAIAAGTKDLEVKAARVDMDGVEHVSLKERLESDLKKGKVVDETKEGNYISFDESVNAPISLELKGNTVQDTVNLLDIKSAGIDNGDGTYTYTVVSCGENLFNKDTVIADYYPDHTNGNLVSSNLYYTSDFIKIDASKTYVRNTIYSDQKRFAFYDKDKKFTNGDIYGNLVPNPNSCYVRVSLLKADLDNFKLQEGTVATPYTPYQEARCDIKLPCQLSGVKGLSDILYYDTTENAWCINKQIAYLNYSELTNVGIASTLTNCIQIHGTSTKEIKQYDSNGSTLITSKKFKHSFDDDEHMWIDSNTWRYKASIPKSIASTLDEAKAYLVKGDLFMYFWDKNPEKIVLPQSEQIKLNSFANKTHVYTVSGEIDAIVKATVSKSLASTVQVNTEEINKINNTIADIQGLKESQDFEYELPNGQNYLVCKDTQSGVVKDFKMYGKSIVNVAPKSITPIKLNIDKRVNDTALISPIRANTEFTVGVNITAKKAPLKGLLVSFHFTDGTFAYEVLSTGVYSQFKTFKFNKDIKAISEYIHTDELTADATANITFDSLIVCDGVINTYFEGVASVGNGNEIEVSSIKWSGNLFDESQLKPYIKYENDIEYEINYEKVWTDKAKLAQLPFKENTQYKFVCSQKTSTADSKPRFYFVYTDGSKDEMTIATTEYTEVTGLSRANKTLDYISATYGVSGAKFTVKKNSICLYENTSKSVYEPYKEDKKTILFKDVDSSWKPVTELNEWDVLDTVNNKLEIGTEKVSFSTSSNWRDNQSPSVTHKTYWKKFDGYKLNNVICDKLPTYNVAMFDEKCIFTVNNEYLYFTIPISECSDISKLGEWFVANPMNILIPSPKKEYEINPIYPDSFEGDTMVIVNGGPIPAGASFKITSSLPNTIKNIVSRVSRIENEFFRSVTTMFKSMLNGNLDQVAYMLYPEDFEKDTDDGIMTIPEMEKFLQ